MHKDAEQRVYDNMFGKRNNQNRGKKQENVHVRQSPFPQGMASFTLDKIVFIRLPIKSKTLFLNKKDSFIRLNINNSATLFLRKLLLNILKDDLS